MSVEHGHTPVQEELPFNPLARKDWSDLPHAEAQKHLVELARRGDDIHDIVLPEAPSNLPHGANLVRAVMNGTVRVEDIPGQEMTESEAAAKHRELDKVHGPVQNWDTLR